MAALVVGLLIRLAILWQTPGLVAKIIDEQQYSQIARSLVAGHGFAWGEGRPTSIRPPLYPAMLAGIWTVAGSENLQAVRVVQILLALATTALVYVLGARIYDARVGRWAAVVCWLYPSFIFFNFLILTETLFTLLLVAFVLLTVLLVQTPRAWLALACGVALAGVGVGANLATSHARGLADVAASGTADCTASLWGPTESDAADVAACVADALDRARP